MSTGVAFVWSAVLAGTPQSITFRYDDDFGLKLGADISRGNGGWFVNTALRASTILLESEIAGEDIDLDPVQIGIGLGDRF